MERAGIAALVAVAFAFVANVGQLDAAPSVVTGVDIELTPAGDGYWVLDSAGRVTAIGGADYHGGSPTFVGDEAAVALVATASGDGYWIVTSAGRVHPFGAAPELGDAADITLAAPIVDAALTADGGGYYLVGADGGVFTFGDAVFAGSVQAIVDSVVAPGFPATRWLAAPIVGIAPSPTGLGYWLVAADGGMFTFGDAAFHGSIPAVLPAGTNLDAPVVAMAQQDEGYLLVASDGGVFNFGISEFHGSIPELGGPGSSDITSVAVAGQRAGYSMLGGAGAIWPFGSVADTLPDLTSVDLAAPPHPGDAVDCADFATLGDAQRWLDAHLPFHGDVGMLDDDSDGRACENDLIDVDPDLRVAFVGDMSLRPDATSVLEVIRDEDADMVIHLGDFDYVDDPDGFEALIDGVLGPDFPYFVAVGNHDVPEWDDYQADFIARLGRVDGASCSGDYGVNSACTYRGLSFVLSGVGTLGSGHEEYLAEQLATDGHMWRVCAWHKNQHALQVGAKTDEVGWDAYETCRRNGAIIATGHEHSYSRTKTLVDIGERTVDPDWPEADSVRVEPGATFAFVSGLGGHSVRDQLRCLPSTPPYGCDGEWASISSASNGGEAGVLLIDLFVDGDRRAGRGRFVDVDGAVIDSFEITNQNERR